MLLIIFIIPSASFAELNPASAIAGPALASCGDKQGAINKSGAAFALKTAIELAIAEDSAEAAEKIIRTACANLDSIETELIIFEFLFLTQRHGRYADNFYKFVKLSDACGDEYLKNYYQRIAKLYSAFVNYALNRDELSVKPGPEVWHKNDILRLLYNKYSAALAEAKKDAALRKASPDFISYLEKKCAAKAPLEGNLAVQTSDSGRNIARAFKIITADARAVRLIERRGLLLLMIYKNIRDTAGDFHKQLIISMAQKNIAEKLINKVVPEIFKK